MSSKQLDPRGLGMQHLQKLRSMFGQKGPIGVKETLVEIQRKAGQDDVMNYIEQHLIGGGTYVANDQVG